MVRFPASHVWLPEGIWHLIKKYCLTAAWWLPNDTLLRLTLGIQLLVARIGLYMIGLQHLGKVTFQTGLSQCHSIFFLSYKVLVVYLVYMYTYIYMYIFIYLNVRIYIYIHIYVNIHMYIYIHIQPPLTLATCAGRGPHCVEIWSQSFPASIPEARHTVATQWTSRIIPVMVGKMWLTSPKNGHSVFQDVSIFFRDMQSHCFFFLQSFRNLRCKVEYTCKLAWNVSCRYFQPLPA